MNTRDEYFADSLRRLLLMIFFALVLSPFCGCGGDGSPVAPDADLSRAVFPMYVDENGNGLNDFVEGPTHDGGSSLEEGMAAAAGPGHPFRDRNGDGVCDHAQDGSPTWHGPGFVDEDGDGVCDWWDEDRPRCQESPGQHFRDRNRNRVNDHYEARWHAGCTHGWVDENGDGICDRAQDGGPGWHGPNCIDGNSNGICDHYEPGGGGYYRHTWTHTYRHGSDSGGGNGNGSSGGGGGGGK